MLSQETKLLSETLIRKLAERHAGEQTLYTGCHCNCGGNSACVLKVHLKQGKVTAIVPDDRYNTGIGREDKVLSDLDLIQAKVQRRACPMAWVFHKHFQNPERILYPLKRKPGSRRGEVSFDRISWDEALDTIVEKMQELRRTYGLYSIMTPYMPNFFAERIFSFFGAGVDTWGWCSQDPENLVAHLMAGKIPRSSERNSSSAADVLFNSKLIVLWGLDPSVTHFGPAHQLAWYLKMARERGTPVICIDPRYTTSAEVLADQWIPIKPGTDMAFMLAIAFILFKENLYNKEFVDKYLEAGGFEKWRRYVLGLDDGIEKSPQWAEEICGVPSATIVEFTRLYARMKPAWLWKNWSVSRKSYGENSARAAATLQAMMGYFGVPGGCLPFSLGAWPTAGDIPGSFGALGPYDVPKVCRSHKWAQAVLLLDEVRSGKLSEEEWRTRVGYRARPELPIPRDFHPRMLWWGGQWLTGSNHLCTGCDSTNDQIKAINRMDFILYMHTTMTPTARYADMILPALDWMWEGKRMLTSAYGGFSTIGYCPGVVPPPGEVKPIEWVYTRIADKLGFGSRFNKYYTNDEKWDESWEKFLKDFYDTRMVKVLASQNIPAPSWQEFKEKGFLHPDEYHTTPFVGFTEEIQKGAPFLTRSGKFEICSSLIESEEEKGKMQYDSMGRLVADVPNDWRSLKSIPVYQPAVHGVEDRFVKKYPLMMLTPHSRYRVHSTFWTVPWLRGDCYRHAAWLSLADARARQIRDGDMVRVYNDRGEIILPAYVTSRIIPGVIAVHQGAWFGDHTRDGGAPAVLLGDTESPVTAPHATTSVQVEKFKG